MGTQTSSQALSPLQRTASVPERRGVGDQGAPRRREAGHPRLRKPRPVLKKLPGRRTWMFCSHCSSEGYSEAAAHVFTFLVKQEQNSASETQRREVTSKVTGLRGAGALSPHARLLLGGTGLPTHPEFLQRVGGRGRGQGAWRTQTLGNACRMRGEADR